jgi:hypothetical protein
VFLLKESKSIGVAEHRVQHFPGHLVTFAFRIDPLPAVFGRHLVKVVAELPVVPKDISQVLILAFGQLSLKGCGSQDQEDDPAEVLVSYHFEK